MKDIHQKNQKPCHFTNKLPADWPGAEQIVAVRVFEDDKYIWKVVK